MTDRVLRLVVLVIGLGCLSLTVRTQGASPSFAVQIEGQGPPMILIPGFVSSGAVWEDVVAHYKTRYTCHVLTLPGFAGQPAIAAPILPRVRDEIIAYIRTRHLEKPVLVGHSLGGFLALWIGATAPDLVGPIVSVDGVPFLPALANAEATSESVRTQAEQMRALYASLTPTQLGMQSRMAFSAMISDPAKVDTAARWATASVPEAASVMISELMTTDLRDQIAAIRTPVLLVAALKAFGSSPGGGDRARAAYREQVKRVPVHQVAFATNALHFVMYDDLRFLLTTVDAFLSPATEPER